jgi:hypothetical protein
MRSATPVDAHPNSHRAFALVPRHLTRLLPALTIAALACGGGSSTGPEAVATLALTPTVSTLRVGETTTLTATPKDAGGKALVGRSVTWNSSSSAVATVTAGGAVTGVTAGTVVISASVESKTAQMTIVVTSGGPDCAAAATISLNVGDVRVLSASERGTLCLPGGAQGSEYALIAVNVSNPRQTSSLTFSSANTVGPGGAPLASSLIARVPTVDPRAITGLAAIEGSMPRNFEFERNLRARWRGDLRRLRAAGPSGRMPSANSAARHSGAYASIKDLPSTPAIGTLVELNASSTSSCDVPLRRTARVTAVTNQAIVVEDTTAPPGGFTNGEYLSIATTFDTLVFPLDTTLFGAPYDMDSNGRVILFFTTAVNQRTPQNSTSVIGGFFWERDLIPRTPNAIVPFACANSNEGEMFYLPVVDAASRYNPFFTSKNRLLAEINSTTIHEFQHLINSSHRIYITPEIVESEEGWLNEGMSHLAEEILYMRVAGVQPRTDLTFTQSTTPVSRFDALNNYQLDNLARFSGYLASTETVGSYADAEDLGTRGAAWALLRWTLDHSSGPPEPYLHALISAPTQGMPNFNNVFSGVGGLATAARNSAIAHYTDNLTTTMALNYSHLSWNFRDWIPRFVSNSGRYPLGTRSLINGIQQNVSLVAGGSAYIRFRVNAGVTGAVSITLGGSAPATATELVLVRSQ